MNSFTDRLWLLICTFFFLSANGLRLIDIHLPSVAFYGQSVELNCTYELEYDQLYSIKWYRDDDEFYRYLPSNFPAEHFYRTRGLYVDLRKSSKGFVHLSRVDLQSDGLFRCEVSAEAPSFQTVRREKQMKVYYLPKESPRIRLKSSEDTFRLGAFLNATCTSGISRPPARLQFLINNQPVDSQQAGLKELIFEYAGPDQPLPPPTPPPPPPPPSSSIVSFDSFNSSNSSTIDSDQPLATYELGDRHRPADDHFWKSSLYRSQLQMLFYLDPSDFAAASWSDTVQPPAINIKCVAFVSHVLTQNAEKILSPLPVELPPPPSSTISSVITKNSSLNMSEDEDEDLAIKSNQSSSLTPERLPKIGGPFILGGQRRYSPGQLINVTCASRKSRYGADLRWYINDREAPRNWIKNYRRIEFDDGIVTMLDLQFLAITNVTTNVTHMDIRPKDDHQKTPTTITTTTTNSTHLTMQQASSLKLRCTATLSRVINMRSKELFLGNNRRGFMASGGSDGNQTTNTGNDLFISKLSTYFMFVQFLVISCKLLKC